MYTWKCHKEIPSVAISNKQKMSFFSKMKDRKVKQALSKGWRGRT
jgi:hypothetical protein